MGRRSGNEARLPPWGQRIRKALQYCSKDGRPGGAVAVGLPLIAIAVKIETLFPFPSEVKAVAGFLLPIVTVGAWGITLAGLHYRKHRGSKSGTPRGGRNRILMAGAVFAASIGLFVLYLAAAHLLLVTQTAPSPAAGGESASKQFVMPLRESGTFRKSLRLHGGLQDVKDNDAEWLEDQLNDQRGGVVATESLLLTLILLSAAAVVVGTTLVSSLPMAPVGKRNVAAIVNSSVGG